MKICTCGHQFTESEVFCPDCGNRVEDIPESTAMPISTPINQVNEMQQPKPASNNGVSPISSMFEAPPKPDPAKKRVVAKPETPKPGPNVEVKPVANPSQGQKLNPLKDPPPVESQFSVLSPSMTVVHVFIMMLPVVGFIYSLIFTVGATSKANTRVLATSFLTAYLIGIVLIAIAFIVVSIFFETTFNQIFSIIKYMADTLFSLLKEL